MLAKQGVVWVLLAVNDQSQQVVEARNELAAQDGPILALTEARDHLWSLREQGLTGSAIAELVGMNLHTVHSRLRKPRPGVV